MTRDNIQAGAMSKPGAIAGMAYLPRRRQQQRAIDTRRAIIDAAMEVFAEVGFERASTRAISERADVPQPLLIYHFKTKEALWQATTMSIFAEVQEEWRSNAQSLLALDPAQRVRFEFKRLFHASLARPHFHRMLAESVADPARRGWIVEQHLKPMFHHVLQDIIDAQAAGSLFAGDPALLYCMLMALSTSLMAFGTQVGETVGRSMRGPEEVKAYWALIERAFFTV